MPAKTAFFVAADRAMYLAKEAGRNRVVAAPTSRGSLAWMP